MAQWIMYLLKKPGDLCLGPQHPPEESAITAQDSNPVGVGQAESRDSLDKHSNQLMSSRSSEKLFQK